MQWLGPINPLTCVGPVCHSDIMPMVSPTLCTLSQVYAGSLVTLLALALSSPDGTVPPEAMDVMDGMTLWW